jgi:hypothetical protein
MSENQALALDLVVGFVVTIGSVFLLDWLGANGPTQALVALLLMCVTCLLIGAIDVHYERKAIERGEDPDDF